MKSLGKLNDAVFLTAFVALVAVALLAALPGCTSVPTDPTPKQQVIANAVEDALSIGLVPVLTKNPDYIAAANSVAAALGTFSGDTITPADVDAFLSKTGIAPSDAKVVAGIVNAAWATYEKRYAQQVNGSVRPDVKLFLAAVANGIRAAVAAVPRS